MLTVTTHSPCRAAGRVGVGGVDFTGSSCREEGISVGYVKAVAQGIESSGELLMMCSYRSLSIQNQCGDN